MSLQTRIISGLCAGAAVGWIARHVSALAWVVTVLEPLGTIFIRLISMVVVPLVIASLFIGVASLGLTLQCPHLQRRSTTLTGIALPTDLPPDRVRQGLKGRGILTAAGLEHYRESAFRIGHMGDIRLVDVASTLEALAAVLQDLRAQSAIVERAGGC